MRIVRGTLFIISALTFACGAFGALHRSNPNERTRLESADEGEPMMIPIFETQESHSDVIMAGHYAYESSEKGYASKKGKGESKSKKSGSKKDKSSKKSSKKSKSSSKDHLMPTPPVDPPSHSRPSDSGDTPYGGQPRPPVPIVPEPTRAPSGGLPTRDSVDSIDLQDATSVELSEFTLEYTVSMDREPDRTDLLQLEGATNAYLDAYMKTRYAQAPAYDLLEFKTVLITSSYASGLPIPVAFMSTAYFAQGSQVPTQDTLDDLVEEAFTGDALENYLDVLANLPVGNVFQTTTSVKLGGGNSSSSSSSTSSRLNTTGIIAGAVGLTLLSAGFILYKIRSDDDEYGNAKSFDRPIGADVTVTGDTYAGAETCDESSAAYSSPQMKDEEQGLSSEHGTDPTGLVERAYDDTSVVPIWQHDEMEYKNQLARSGSGDNDDERSEGSQSDGVIEQELGELTEDPCLSPRDPEGVSGSMGDSVASMYSVDDSEYEEVDDEESSFAPRFVIDDSEPQETNGDVEEDFSGEGEIRQTVEAAEEENLPAVSEIMPSVSNETGGSDWDHDRNKRVEYPEEDSEVRSEHEQPSWYPAGSMQEQPSLDGEDEESSLAPATSKEEEHQIPSVQSEETDDADQQIRTANRPLTVDEIESLLTILH